MATVKNPFDTTELPTTEPPSIVAGSHVAWSRPVANPVGYTYRYDLIPLVSGTTLTVTGVVANDVATFTVLSATSTGWASGEYRWNLVVVRDSDSEETIVESDRVTIFASTEDRRTHAEIMVQKIESLLQGRADHDIDSYTIKSRSISRMGVSELRQWRDYYLDEIQRTGGSTSKAGGAPSNTIRVRFV